jgi:peptide/nickel transport system substrate-binding protein
MSVWSGLENGLPTADTSPDELAPTSQIQLQWPKFGQHYETSGKVGEAPDIAEVKRLVELYVAWRKSATPEERRKVWD